VPELARRLLDTGYTVLIETSGERDVSVLDPRVIKIMDLKCPGSGESHRNRWENLEYLTPKDEIKFVIKDRADYDWSVKVVKEYGLDTRFTVLLSPVWGELEPVKLARWILQDKLNVRFQLQLHKIVWPPQTRGV
jgi:7-carboxy-7-deazaguanine synthase